MATKVKSLHFIANEAPHDQVRDLVLPLATGNRGYLGVLFHDRPPWLVDIQTGKRVDTPFQRAAVGMAFRPFAATEINSERNQEVAIVYGAESARVEFFDAALGVMLEPLFFPRAQTVAYNHQGDKLALGGATGSVSVYTLPSNGRRKELVCVQVCKQAIVRLAFTGQGESVYALTARGSMYCIELATGEVTEVTLAGADEDADFDCWAHALHSEARLAVLAGSANRAAGQCKVWLLDIDKGGRTSFLTGHKCYIRRVQFIGDSQLMVIGDQGAELYDLPSKTRCHVARGGDKLAVAYAAVQFGTSAFVVGSAAPVKGAA